MNTQMPAPGPIAGACRTATAPNFGDTLIGEPTVTAAGDPDPHVVVAAPAGSTEGAVPAWLPRRRGHQGRRARCRA